MFKPIFCVAGLVLLVPCIALCGTPKENDAVDKMAKKIERRHAGEPSVYRGIYRIWSSGTVQDVQDALEGRSGSQRLGAATAGLGASAAQKHHATADDCDSRQPRS